MYAKITPIGGGFPGVDNELPEGGGGHPDHSLPEPPPGIWPPPVPAHPIVPAPPHTPPGTIWPPVNRPVDPGYGRPSFGGRPDNSLPGRPARPDQGLPGRPHRPSNELPGHPVLGGGRPDQGLPSQPPSVDNTVPGANKKFWIVAGIPGYGWKYVCVDISLTIDHELPSGGGGSPDQSLPGAPDQTLPPTTDGGAPDQTLPGAPDQTLPGTPPTATPKKVS